MDVPLILEGEYIPEWNGNKESANPVVAVLQALTGAQRSECMSFRSSDGTTVTGQVDMSKMVGYGVKELRNLTVGEIPVVTGRQLVASKGVGVDRLILELAAEIILRNQEQDLKNS